MKALNGRKITLRKMQKKHLRQSLLWINNPAIADLTDTAIPIKMPEHKKWLRKRDANHSKMSFAIETAGGKHVGNIFLDDISCKNKSAKISVYIGDVTEHHKGYGSDAMNRLLEFCFSTLRLHKVYLTVLKHNKKAFSLYKKIGFKKEGILRGDVLRYGKYYDNIRMGILADEFRAG